MVGIWGCKDILPGHVKLLINQHSQVLFHRPAAAHNPFSTQIVPILIALIQVQNVALGLDELHGLHGPHLKSFKECIPFLWCVVSI